MVSEIFIYPEAEAQFIHSYSWYETQQIGLGDRFAAAFEQVLEKIKMAPETYGYGSPPFREARIPKFPYAIVYLFLEETNHVYVLSVHHERRDPGLKFEALE